MTEPAALPRTEPELDSTTRTDQSEELATTTLLRAAIGAVNTDYYLGIFSRFDARDRVGPHWNTAAALSTLNWMLYRRMWNAALTYTGLALTVALLVFGIGKLAFHYTSELQWALAAAYALVLVALPGLFGNALLFKQYRRDMALAVAAHATLPQAAATLLARAPTRQRLLVLGGINILGAAAFAGLGLWASAFNGMPTALGTPGAAPAAPVVSGKVAVGRAVDALPPALAASAPANPASAPTTPTTPASGPSATPAAAASAPAAPVPVAAASSPATSPASKGAASAPAAEKQAASSAPSATANAGRGSVHAPMAAAPQAAALAAPTPTAEKTEAARLAPQASAQQRAPRTSAASAPKTTPATAPAPASARKAPATPAARADNSASRPETATRSPATARSGPRAAGSTAATPAAPTAPAAPAVPAKRADTAPAPAMAAGSFGINVGLFADDNNARNAMVLLGDAGLPAYTQTLRSKKGPLTRVRVGPFDSQAQAERTAEQIRALGLETLVFQQAP